MAIAQAMCSSFKQELFQGIQVIGTDTFKIALYSSSATLGASTTVYTTSNEITGTGYTAGGLVLTGASVALYGTTAIATFSNPSWTTATFTARGALIYNSSKANRAVAVLDFGSDKIVSAGTFTIQIPTPDATNALLRIA